MNLLSAIPIQTRRWKNKYNKIIWTIWLSLLLMFWWTSQISNINDSSLKVVNRKNNYYLVDEYWVVKLWPYTEEFEFIDGIALVKKWKEYFYVNYKWELVLWPYSNASKPENWRVIVCTWQDWFIITLDSNQIEQI